MDPQQLTCFTCGLAVDGEPRLNRLQNGAVCPTCRDRLLECLPPLFPGGEIGAGEQEEIESEAQSIPQARGPRALAPVRSRKRKKSRPGGG